MGMHACNYCIFERMKRDAKKKGLRIVTISESDGVAVHALKEGERPTKRNWRCWFMELTAYCCC